MLKSFSFSILNTTFPSSTSSVNWNLPCASQRLYIHVRLPHLFEAIQNNNFTMINLAINSLNRLTHSTPYKECPILFSVYRLPVFIKFWYVIV